TKKADLGFGGDEDYDQNSSDFIPNDPTVRSELIEARPPRVEDDELDLRNDIRERLDEFINAEAPVIVRKAIESYCEKHFAEIARAVLTAELRRLADEKARLLVDS